MKLLVAVGFHSVITWDCPLSSVKFHCQSTQREFTCNRVFAHKLYICLNDDVFVWNQSMLFIIVYVWYC